ncbi:AI-2E family transporter [Candidatus Obscuribacterales bacterium]|nr:AI-2E family transporter [Candidatus Obscuribacterales bacterium]
MSSPKPDEGSARRRPEGEAPQQLPRPGEPDTVAFGVSTDESLLTGDDIPTLPSGAQLSVSNEQQKLAILQRRLVIITLGLLIAFLAIQVLQTFSDILRILSLAIFVCYTVVGLVDLLERYIKSRLAAVLTVYALGSVTIAVAIIIVIPILVYQISQLLQSTFDQIPAFINTMMVYLEPLEKKLSAANIHMKPSDILVNLAATAPKPDAGLIMAHLTTVATSTLTWLFYGLSILILAFYFLLDGSRMSRETAGVFPDAVSARVLSFFQDTDRSLHSFFKGQIVLGLLFGAFMVAVYSLMGVPYALALGIILGVWEIVPVIGPTVGIIPTVIAVLVAGVEHIHADRIVQLAVVLVVFGIFQWLKDNIVGPKYIGNVIGLHPVIIFIAIMIGARLDGMLGVIVSLPVACMVNVFIKHLRHPQVQDGPAVAVGISPDIAVQVSSSGEGFAAEGSLHAEPKA